MKRRYSQFDLDTELELACIFKRPPRWEPRPHEIPYYPYLPSKYDSPPYRVNFSLGFNPFAIN